MRSRRVCVCIVLVHFGRFPQEVNEKSVKLAVWAVSLNFLHDFTLFVVDIHQIRLISLFRHLSDHFHFHPTLEQKRAIDLRPCRIKLSYKCFEKNRAKWDMFKDVGGARYFLYLKYIWNMRCLMKRLNGSSSVIQGDIWYLKAISFTLGLQT